jgi:peptidoglycan/xylan/chitin deacetylase (PgdA/CDA1 family)
VLRRLTRPVRERVAEAWRRRPGDAAVLMYHRIAEPEPDMDPFRLTVSAAHFGQHLALLRERFRATSLAELVNGLERGSVPRRSVVVTFDDGYRDTVHVARPLLERYEVPATVFVVSAYVDSPRDFWWDELAQLEAVDGIPGDEDYRTVWQRLRALGHAERLAALDALWEKAGKYPPSATLVPSAREVASLEDGGLLEVGAHTATHARLPDLSPEAQFEEIQSGKERLDVLLGRPSESFSYPYGEYDRAGVDCVERAGFRRACTGSQRAVRAGTPALEIPRLYVDDVSGEELGRLLDRRLRP